MGQGNRWQQVVSKRQVKIRRGGIVMGVLLFCSLLLLLSIRVRFIERSYELEEWREKVLKNDAIVRDYALRYSSVVRPVILKGRATKELGMTSIARRQVRYLSVPSQS